MSSDKRPSSTRPLADLVGGRDNNFNLIRFLAASAVLYSHSYALSAGTSMAEPLRPWLGITPGYIAVDVFFLTSGFLVTSSLLGGRDLLRFAVARALRIYPALLVAVVLTVMIVGFAFTSLPPRAFFSDPNTWRHVARNATLVFGVEHNLPGAFEATPWRSAVNTSLWTLPYEIGMYAFLATIWIGLSAGRSDPAPRVGKAVATVCIAALGAHVLLQGTFSSSALRLTAMFFAGAGFFVFRTRLPISGSLLALCVFSLAVASLNKSVFAVIYPLAIPYVVFYMAYVPGGVLRKFNELGDYSYGIYIYAWPVQQMTAASIPGIKQPEMLYISFTVTLLLAMLSWHLIEKRALALKDRRRQQRTAGVSLH